MSDESLSMKRKLSTKISDEPLSKKKKLSTNVFFFGSDDNYYGKNVDVLATPVDSPEIEVDDPSVDGLKIVHLNDECLVKIFRHLSIIDLINVAEANVRLAVLAKHIFAQLYENHPLCLELSRNVIEIPKSYPSQGHIHCILNGHNSVENMLKHFGKHLQSIIVSWDTTGCTSQNNLLNLIAEHCGETLIELECSDHSYAYLDRINKPFVRLEKLILSYAQFHEKPLKMFNKLFPNLRFLEFYNFILECIPQFIAVGQRYPHLEHFGVYNFPCISLNEKIISCIKQVLSNNPQIKSLRVFDMKQPLDKLPLELMSNIERLVIGGTHIKSIPFQLGNIKSLKLIYSSENQANYIDWSTLPAQLERLELVGFDVNERLTSLALQCPNLKSLAMMAFRAFDLKYIQQIAEHLQQLEQVEFISGFKEDVKKPVAFLAALKCIKHCPRLQRAIVTIEIDETESQYKINKWTYKRSNEFLKSYKELLEKTLIFDWWRWSIRHEVKMIDFRKEIVSKPYFRVILENTHAIEHN